MWRCSTSAARLVWHPMCWPRLGFRWRPCSSACSSSGSSYRVVALSIPHADNALRRMVRIVALLNLSYFGIEFAVALAIGSVAPFADSIDFLKDASVNVLIFVALGWSAVFRAHIGMALAGILLIPGLATLWTAWEKFNMPIEPDPLPLSLAGLGALAATCSVR